MRRSIREPNWEPYATTIRARIRVDPDAARAWSAPPDHSTTRSARFIRRCTTAREAGKWLAGCRRLNTDHGAAPRNDEDPPGGRAVLVEGSYCAIWEEPSARSAHLNCRRQRRPTGFVIRPGLGSKGNRRAIPFARPCGDACVDNGPVCLCQCGRRGRSLRQPGVGDSPYAIGCDPGQRVGGSSTGRMYCVTKISSYLLARP